MNHFYEREFWVVRITAKKPPESKHQWLCLLGHCRAKFTSTAKLA